MDLEIARLSEPELLTYIFERLEQGKGGWLITANLDFLRRAWENVEERKLFAQADLRVADGMPLIWASKILDKPLPERIAGSNLIEPLAKAAAAHGRSLYMLGGNAGAAEGAADYLTQSIPGLTITGISNPFFALPPTEEEIQQTVAQIQQTPADIILVALGSPKQEWVISKLRDHFPQSWFIGVGISFGFLSGQVPRAPEVIQKLGLEWAFRLATEPKRLARRYLVEDLPFFARMVQYTMAERTHADDES